jgi:hypothetical protein
MTRSPWVEVNDLGKSIPELGYRLEWYSSSTRAWSTVILQVRLLAGEVRAKPPSHASDGATESTLAVARYWCRVMRAMALPRQLGHDTISVPSHASDDAVEATWPHRDVSIESCWRWCRLGNMATAWCLCRVMLAMTLPRWLGRGAVDDHANMTSGQIYIQILRK